MEIKTCEQYVLDQLEQALAERDWLRGKLEQAQDEAEEPMAAWEAAKWARDWIVEHYKDMQEDWCKRFDG